MKKVVYLTVALACVLFLAACNRNGDDNGNDVVDGRDVPAYGTGIALTIYSNDPIDRLDQLAALAAESGFNLQPVSLGGGDLANRLYAERHNPIADVIFGLNPFLLQQVIADDLLTPFVPVWADRVPVGQNHPQGYFHAVIPTAILLVYDRDQIDTPPTDWLELGTNPAFHGRYQFENHLGGSTTRMVLAGIFGRFQDPNGHLNVSDEGWEHIRAFFANGHRNVGGVHIFAQMVSDETDVVMGQFFCAGVPGAEEQFEINSGFVVPAVGVPMSVPGVAVVNGSSNLDEARRFINWFTPEIRDSLRATPPDPRFDGVPTQIIDWAFIADNMDAWVEHIYLHYMP